MAPLQTIGIVGAGAWGTALAQAAARAGRDVVLWARAPEVVRTIAERRVNPRHLPDVTLEPAVRARRRPGRGDGGRPRAADRPGAGPARAGGRAPGGRRTAGDRRQGARDRDRAAAERGGGGGAAGQPSRGALEAPTSPARWPAGLPAASTLGCADPALGARAAAAQRPALRVYWTDDVVGVEVGGAVKNVLAIAAGIVAGRGLGENAQAALITRGLAELARSERPRAPGARP